MGEVRGPVEKLEFSDDPHLDDVEPLEAFLAARLGELVLQWPEGSDEHFAAVRLCEVTSVDCVFSSDITGIWGDRVGEGRGEESGLVQRLCQDMAQWRNRLCETAPRFSDHRDFSPRWRQLADTYAEHVAIEEAMAQHPAQRSG